MLVVISGFWTHYKGFMIYNWDRQRYTAAANAELPVKFGHGSNQPVVVLPVLVNSKDSDYEARYNDLLSLKNVKYSLAPQYVLVGNQENDRIRSRVRYITVEPESADDFDDPIIVAESPSENNYPVYRPTTRMRKKFVIKISPRQNVRVSEDVQSSTTPFRGYIPVSETSTTTPSREYIPVIDNMVTTPSQQFQPPFVEDVVTGTVPLNQLTYVAGDVNINSPAPEQEWQLIGNVVSITPPNYINYSYLTNNVFSIQKGPGQKGEDTSDQPPIITSERPDPKNQPPNITSERPNSKEQPPNITNNTPINFIWNLFNYPFSTHENRTTSDETSKPSGPSTPRPLGPDDATTTAKPSDPEISPGLPKTEKATTTEKPNTSGSPKSTPEPDSPTATVRPSDPESSPGLPKTEKATTTEKPNTSSSPKSTSEPDSPTATVRPSDPESSPGLPKTGKSTTTEKPNTSSSPKSTSEADSPTTIVRPSDPESSTGLPKTGKSTTTEKPNTSSSPKSTPEPDSPTTTKRPYRSKTSHPGEKYPNEKYIPFAHGLDHLFDTTPKMINSYQQEKPYNPELPSLLPSRRKFPKRIPNEKYGHIQVTPSLGPSPAIPRFKRSMRLRIDVKVPRSDYTEAYDMQWDVGTNTARTVVEDGATIFYRMPLFDGRIQYIKFKNDTMNGTAIGRCTMSPLLPAAPQDQEFPGLPDLSPFQFIGYTSSENQPLVERWRHWVIGKPGQDGAAIGEALNYTHDFLLYRDQGEPMPLRYTVVAHSSVLGPYSDMYTHRYRILPAPTGPVLPEKTKMCQIIEQMEEEPFLKTEQRDLSTMALPKGTPMPDDDILSENEDITPNPILGAGDIETDAVNKDNIAANINIGTGHGANLVSHGGGVVANINIGARDHFPHRRIVANINIGAGRRTLDTDTRDIANLNVGAADLNHRLEADGANLFVGTRGDIQHSSRRGLADRNFGTRRRQTGLGLDKQDEDGIRNSGPAGRRDGAGFDREGVYGNRNFGGGSRRDGVSLDNESVDENRNSGTGGRRNGVGLDRDDVGLEGVNGNRNSGGRRDDLGLDREDVDRKRNFGKGGRRDGVGLDREYEDGNRNSETGGRRDGVGLDRDGVDGNKNLGQGSRRDGVDLDREGVNRNRNSRTGGRRDGVSLNREGVNGNKKNEISKESVTTGEASDENADGNTTTGNGGRGNGITSDIEELDPNVSSGTGGSKPTGASTDGAVDETSNNGTEDLNMGVIDKGGVDTNSKNKTGDRSESGGKNKSSKSDSLKDSFNPMKDFLGQTKSKKYDDLFEQYKKKYKRKYKDDGEEAVRKAQFIKTLRYVEAANRIATTYKLGINYMSDRLKDELRPMVSGVPPVSLDQIAPGATPAPVRRYEKEFMTNDTIHAKVAEKDFPLKFSWKEMGFDTKVRHQGVLCLSCSLMATTGAVEGLIFAKKNENKLLSPQSMLDCGEKFSKELKWCEATFPRDAFKFIKDKGLPSDDDYKFVTPPKEPMCKDDVMSAEKIKDFYHLRMDADSTHLRLAIKSKSPVVVVFKVLTGSSPQHYEKGVLDDMRWCHNAETRHSVVAVGYDFTQQGQEHFTFKNSWGDDWGDKGYAKIKSGDCNVLTDVSYPVL